MNIEKYLQRFGFEGTAHPSLDVLGRLQKGHLLKIPFENLDIHRGCRIELKLEKLYNKIVCSNRGGFCYELNGLFYWLLTSIGFNAKMISARVYNNEGGYGFEFDHLAIIVNIDHREYLTDVGFGEYAFSPLLLEQDTIQNDERGLFRIVKHDEQYLRSEKKSENGWVPEYIFTLIERKLADFEEMCTYHQTSPQSSFTRKRVCSLPFENGRITITGNILKNAYNNKVTETPISSEEEYLEMLSKYFGIRF